MGNEIVNRVFFISSFEPEECCLGPGGRRRYSELYFQLKYSGVQADWVDASLLGLWHSVRHGSQAGGRVIYLVFDERYLMYALIASLWGGSVVMFPRGDKMMHDNVSGKLRRCVKRVLLTALYKGCDAMLFQSAAQRDQFRKDYGVSQPSDVVYNNVNASWIAELGKTVAALRHERERPAINDVIRVGFMGGDDPRKGLSLALEAVQELRTMDFQAELVVAGTCSNAVTWDNEEYISYLGFLRDTESFWSTIDILWVPSKYDSFPNVCLEAVSTSTPFLISENTISREIFTDPSLCHRRAKAFATQTVAMLYGPEKEKVRVQLDSLKEDYTFDWAMEVMESMTALLEEEPEVGIAQS